MPTVLCNGVILKGVGFFFHRSPNFTSVIMLPEPGKILNHRLEKEEGGLEAAFWIEHQQEVG